MQPFWFLFMELEKRSSFISKVDDVESLLFCVLLPLLLLLIFFRKRVKFFFFFNPIRLPFMKTQKYCESPNQYIQRYGTASNTVFLLFEFAQFWSFSFKTHTRTILR